MGSTDTRGELLRAATLVFAETGFSGARVDEIARRARANKAMIYYHFGGKKALYHTVFADLFAPILEETRRLEREEPDRRLRLLRFYRHLVERFSENHALPRIMMREVLSGGRGLNQETVRIFVGLLGFVYGTVREGVEAGEFAPVDPLFLHFSMIGPIFLFFAGEAFRTRLQSLAAPDVALPGVDTLLHHIEEILTRSLKPRETVGDRT